MSFPGKFSDHLLPHQLHKISVSFLVDSMRRQRGGIAANIAYTNALLGSRPQVMATAGKDFREYGIWLEKKGVDTSGIVIYEDDFCASFFVNTDEDQNQIASFYTGAMAYASSLTFANYAPDADMAIISPNDPTAMCAYVKECKALGIAYIYDPSQQIIRLSAEDLENGINGCSILTVNEYELEMIREKTGLIQEDILQRAGGLLLTLGKNGSQIFSGGQKYDIPAVKPRKIVEPTGAGDAFRGGLIRGIQLGLGWDIAGRIGSLAAAYVLENLGTQGHNFTISEFIERYRENFDDQGTLDMLLSE
jgi:adenosine kinase